MREIKFRGLSLSDNNWLFGQYARSLYEEDHYILEDLIHVGSSEWSTDANTIHCKTLGQFTGITDKKGIEIYEGDIVRVRNSNFVVTFTNGSWVLKWDNTGFGLLHGFCNANNMDSEVIGNIHQNPELLEE